MIFYRSRLETWMENTVSSDDFQKKIDLRREGEGRMTGKKNPITIFFLKLYLEVIIFCYCTKNERNKFLSCFDVCGVKFLICKYRIATFRKPILIHISRNIRSGP